MLALWEVSPLTIAFLAWVAVVPGTPRVNGIFRKLQLQVKKLSALHLARGADAKMSFAGAFAKFRLGESSKVFCAGLGTANPDGQAVGLILK